MPKREERRSGQRGLVGRRGLERAQQQGDELDQALAEKKWRFLARRQHLEFMDYCWRSPQPLVVGRHTREIAERLDRALAELEEGKSTYLVVTVPYRHGKSDLISRYFIPHVLGCNADLEVILGTYGASLSEELSADARDIFESAEFQKLYPGLELKKRTAAHWSVKGRRGKVRAVGIEGSATGKGADVLIIDDYLKGRDEAESQTIRDKVWENFTNNFMSRLAPAHIVVVLATRWHRDDLIGRLLDRMSDREANPDFPAWEVIHYRAREERGDGTAEYLFPERYPEEWYRGQFASLGSYAALALLQGDPVIRGGNMIKVDRIRFVKEFPPGLLWIRFWDLASTEEERTGDDPDRTAGARLAVGMVRGKLWLFIDDFRWCRAEAPERDRMIIETARADGSGVWQGVEAVAGYKDTAATLKKVLKGVSVVYPTPVQRDKVVRAADVEPLFEAGHVALRAKAWWISEVIAELADFPGGAHDDRLDAISGGYQLALKRYLKAHRHGGGLGKGACP